MLPYNKPKLWVPGFIFTIGLFITIVIIKMSDESNYKYSEITNNTIINAVVTDIEYVRTNACITMSDSNFFGLTWAYNYNYTPSELSEFIQVGDSLTKESNSDRIYIHRAGKEYEFQFIHRIPKKTSN